MVLRYRKRRASSTAYTCLAVIDPSQKKCVGCCKSHQGEIYSQNGSGSWLYRDDTYVDVIRKRVHGMLLLELITATDFGVVVTLQLLISLT